MGVAGRLKAAAVAVVAVPLLVLLIPAQLVLMRTRAWHVVPTLFWRVVLRLMGVRVRVLGAPMAGGAVLIVANHVSWLDIPILSGVTRAAFIAKAEVGRWPGIGPLSRLQRTVYVDRTRRTATAATNREVADRMAAGEALVLFAEGTSSAGSRVLPFRASLLGGVRDAAQAGGAIAVQPLAICYRGCRGLPMTRRDRARFAWYGDMELGPHLGPAVAAGVVEIDLVFGEAVPFAPGDDRKAVARQLERAVAAMLAERLTGRPAPSQARHGTGSILNRSLSG